VYIGTFTDGSSQGIYVSRIDTVTGRLAPPELAAATTSPNFLAVSPDGRFLYSATRISKFKGMPGGAVSAFVIDGHTGQLRLRDQQFCGSADPCHVSVDATGQTVVVANYNGGSVKSFHVKADGSLIDGTFIQHHGRSVNTNRQSAAHAHCIVVAPEGRHALACDLGMDKVLIYQLNPANAALTPDETAFAAVTPGSGPRHLAFSPNGKIVYVVNEMACTVTTFAWDGINGKLDTLETVTLLPPGVALANSFAAAEIAVRPDGRFIYATVRGHDSITVLAADQKSGKLSFLENVPCGGKVPRGMGIDPTGRWLIVANQKSGTVAVFGIDAGTGRLTPTAQVLSIDSPVDVKFAPMSNAQM